MYGGQPDVICMPGHDEARLVVEGLDLELTTKPELEFFPAPFETAFFSYTDPETVSLVLVFEVVHHEVHVGSCHLGDDDVDKLMGGLVGVNWRGLFL